MTRLLKEPLVHFLLLGAALFAVAGMVGDSRRGAPGAIVITGPQVESLRAEFARTWRRPPTAEELDGLIQDRVREEVYCREAVALGLDEDDAVIRRRLRQKMEFLSEDLQASAEPTEADLRDYLSAHPSDYRVDGRMPGFEELKDRVRADWANAKRLEANETFFQELLKRYTVRIEGPGPQSGTP